MSLQLPSRPSRRTSYFTCSSTQSHNAKTPQFLGSIRIRRVAGSVHVLFKTSKAKGHSIFTRKYDPWGQVLTPSGTATAVPAAAPIGQTTRNYTGQKLDGTGLLDYNARMYDPWVGRFVSPDSIVPGEASGVGGAADSLGQEQNSKLTVDFHERSLLASAKGENAKTLTKGFWFQMDGGDKPPATAITGPQDPQALGRYNYVLDNPLRYVDPTGNRNRYALVSNRDHS